MLIEADANPFRNGPWIPARDRRRRRT